MLLVSNATVYLYQKSKQLKTKTMKNYSKKTPKAYVPKFTETGEVSQAHIDNVNANYKQNPANFKTFGKSWNEMSSVEKYQFELEREADKRGSHSTF